MTARKGKYAAGGSSVERVLVEIQRLIFVQGMKVGDKLPGEVELAQTLGASRNTIREAIRTLKAYGIVEARPRLGSVLVDNRHAVLVKLFSFGLELSPATFHDVQQFRRLIEQGSADNILARATEADLDQLDDIITRMRNAENVAIAATLDFQFHRRLVELAGNETALSVYAVMEPVIVRVLESGKDQPDHLVEIANEHRQIVQTLREKDRSGYLSSIESHLGSGLKYILERLTSI